MNRVILHFMANSLSYFSFFKHQIRHEQTFVFIPKNKYRKKLSHKLQSSARAAASKVLVSEAFGDMKMMEKGSKAVRKWWL